MHAIGATYTRAVQRAGGTPVVIPPMMLETDWPVLIDRLDGLLLSGGEDIAPARYGQALEPWTGLVDEERDHTELGLVRAWLARSKPLLAICRGHQVLNVALGGTLYQDIMTQVTAALDHAYVTSRPMENSVHDVDIEKGSALARILGGHRFAVNSAHHQAVWQPGQGLGVVARASDGIVEGIELADYPFCVGVQWHPEAMLKVSDSMLPLFEAFVAASA